MTGTSTAIEARPAVVAVEEWRARALQALMSAGWLGGIGMAGTAPYVLIAIDVERATHPCAQDYPCRESSEEL